MSKKNNKISKNLANFYLAAFSSLILLISFALFLFYFFEVTDEVSYIVSVNFLGLGFILNCLSMSFIFWNMKKISKEDYKLAKVLLILMAFQVIPVTFMFAFYMALRSGDTRLKYKVFKHDSTKPIVDVRNLELSFEVPEASERKKVIRNVSLKLYEGEVLAIIGESGSGKSVLTSALYGLPGRNSRIDKGKIILSGKDVTDWSQQKWRRSGLRGNFISSVFQNPMTTLNPTQKIGQQLMEGLFVNDISMTRKTAKKECIKYLRKTKISNPEQVFDMYPHELSGGMKQRIVIAAILVCRPRILILDEPTTALDPTIQAQVLEIIKELRKEFKLSIIFITHDLGVVASLADKIAIMYAGKIVESGDTREVMLHSQHPYTWGLILSMPDLNIGKSLRSIPGSVPLNLNSIKGDAFAPRNEYCMGKDLVAHPPFFEVSKTHQCASWLLDDRSDKYDPPAEIIERWNRWAKIKEDYDANYHLKTYKFNKRQHKYVKVRGGKNGN